MFDYRPSQRLLDIHGLIEGGGLRPVDVAMLKKELTEFQPIKLADALMLNRLRPRIHDLAMHQQGALGAIRALRVVVDAAAIAESDMERPLPGTTKKQGSALPDRGTNVAVNPFKGLPEKTQDLTQYFDGLTDRQRDCVSLRFEYGLPIAKIAKRLGIHRKTVDEHLQAAEGRMKLRYREKKTGRVSKDTSRQ